MARTGGEPGAPAAGPPAPPAGAGEPGEPAGWPRASPRRNLKARAHQAASYTPFPTWLTRRDDEGGTARAGRGDLEHLRGGRRGGAEELGSPLIWWHIHPPNCPHWAGAGHAQ